MATSTSPVANQSSIEAAKISLWLWPNLLSLDAPIIAALWQNVFAHDAGVRLSMASRALLPFAVWLIYLVDRLLDTAKSAPPQTARHNFCAEKRAFCYVLTAVASLGCLVSLLHLPLPVFRNGLVVLGMVATYLIIVHGIRRRWLPKEVVVGGVFSIGSVLSPITWSSHPIRLLLPALLFGILCWTNTAAIETWEGGKVDAASRWMVQHLDKVAIAICLLCVMHGLFLRLDHSWMALILAALGYRAVVHLRPLMVPNLLRVSIDVPLLAPLLLLGLR